MTEATRPALKKRETEKATYAPDAIKLRDLGAQPTAQALPRAAAFLADLVQDSSFLGSQVLAVLEEARGAEGWYVAIPPGGPTRARPVPSSRSDTRGSMTDPVTNMPVSKRRGTFPGDRRTARPRYSLVTAVSTGSAINTRRLPSRCTCTGHASRR